MSTTQSGEKTEKPSPKRWKDARKKGQVARSRDLAIAVSLLAVTLAAAAWGGRVGGRLALRVADAFEAMGERALATLTPGEVGAAVVSDGWLLVLAVGPFLVVGVLAGTLSSVAQSGWVFAPEALTPNWNRLSPSQGLSRFKPMHAGMDLLKSLIGVAVVGAIAYRVGRDLLADSATLSWMAPAEGARVGWDRVIRLLWQAGLAAALLAGADYGLQRWRLWSSLKMTKQEVRDEQRASDGSPESRARIRRLQRDLARRGLLTAVKGATVVVTNPTHFAVALEYRRERMAAPVVAAKGRDLVAARIRAIAREHGVPVVENVPLAQALYKGAEVGDTIPAALFGAVAEVLAYLVRIRQLLL